MVRSTGLLESVAEVGDQDHLCWAYDDDGELVAAVVEFLAAGLAAGQRVAYAADAGVDELRRVVAPLGPTAELLAAGSLVLVPTGDLYRDGEPFDPRDQLDAYAAHTRTALAEGFSGFRVAAEATSLVRDAGRRAVFCRYEHEIDRYLATAPFAAMCAYDRRVLGDDAVADLACLHPAVHGPPEPPFRLYALDPGTVAVSGELDWCASELFERAVRCLPGGPLTVEVSGLDFIDHRAVLTLERFAARHGPVRLEGATGMLERLCGLLGTEHLQLAS